jgi:integrase
MARVYQMSWDGPRARWTKMYRGARYYVACSVLNAPATKEASYQAANEWWRRKRAEVDSATAATPGAPPSPLEELSRAVGAVSRQDFEDAVLGHGSGLVVLALELLNGRLPEGLAARLAAHLPADRVRQIAASSLALCGEEGAAAAAPEKTVGALAERWLALQAARVAAGRLSAGRCANDRSALEQFKNFLGPQAGAGAITAESWESFYLHCLARVTARQQNGPPDGWSAAYARDAFSVAGAFVRWLADSDLIAAPRNLGRRGFDFGASAPRVTTWTVEEFRKAVECTRGVLRLAVLLSANCGMTNKDVSDLLDAEVDWATGRVTRKRSKTKGLANVPTVSYPLWPPTFALLKEHRSGKERVLLNLAGKPFVQSRLRPDGRKCESDGIHTYWEKARRRLCLARPLKQLRKLGASLLASHEVYGRLVQYFLGHSASTMADRHYVVPPQGLLDEAVTWLGSQLGQV